MTADTQRVITDQILANLMADRAVAPKILAQLADLPQSEQDRLIAILGRPEPKSLVDAVMALPSSKPIETMSSDYILRTAWPEPVWIVPEMLPSGLAILAGAPKVGKSWLALQLCLAKAAGGNFFDKTISQGPVLYLALEDPPRRLQSRMRQQHWIEGLPADFLTLGNFEEQIGDLRNGGGEKLARQIETKRYELVVVDTLSRAIAGDQQDVREMTEWLTPLQEMSHQVNTALVIVDHHRKAGKYGDGGGDPIADVLGSTAKGAMVDTSWGLYRERGQTNGKLMITGREVIEMSHEVEFDQEYKYWKPTGENSEGGIKSTPRRMEIIDYLTDTPRATCEQIAKAVNQPKQNTHTRLMALVESGELKRIIVDNKPYYEVRKNQ